MAKLKQWKFCCKFSYQKRPSGSSGCQPEEQHTTCRSVCVGFSSHGQAARTFSSSSSVELKLLVLSWHSLMKNDSIFVLFLSDIKSALRETAKWK